jgi:hypothetical protein
METILNNNLLIVLLWVTLNTMILTFVPTHKIHIIGDFFKKILGVLPITGIIKMLQKKEDEDNKGE